MASTASSQAASNSQPLPSTPDKHANVGLIGDCISIKVGKNDSARKSDIHKGLLKHYSGYFRTAIKNIEEGRFAESAGGVIVLEEEDVPTFCAFRNWLYSQQHKIDPNSATDPEADYKLVFGVLTDIWNFADRRDIPLLRNRVVDIWISKLFLGQYPSCNQVKQICTTTPEGSGLRELVAWQYFNYLSKDEGASWKGSFKDEWFKEFAARVFQYRLIGVPFVQNNASHTANFDQCQFHSHEQGVRCQARGFRKY